MTAVAQDKPEHTIVCDGLKDVADEPTSVFLQAWNDTNVYLETFHTAGERRTSDGVCKQMETVLPPNSHLLQN